MIAYGAFKPNYSLGRYSPCDAYSFCLASSLAYEERPFIVTTAKTWGFGFVKPFHVKRGKDIDTQGFVASDNQRILIALRGTESLADLLTNVQVLKDPGPCGANVHKGFQDALHAVTLTIGKIVGENFVNHKIWLTGHSLGGALAVLLAAELLELGLAVDGLLTFAAPRVGDSKLAKCLDRKLKHKANWRVANEDDLVPHLPWKSLRFRHAGNPVLLLNSGRVSKDSRTWLSWEKTTSMWLGSIFEPPKILAPHRLATGVGYLKRLRRHCRPNIKSPRARGQGSRRSRPTARKTPYTMARSRS